MCNPPFIDEKTMLRDIKGLENHQEETNWNLQVPFVPFLLLYLCCFILEYMCMILPKKNWFHFLKFFSVKSGNILLGFSNKKIPPMQIDKS